MENENKNRGLLVFLTILVIVVMVAILVASGFNKSDVETGEEGFFYMIKRALLYVKYLLLELIALLFMQK